MTNLEIVWGAQNNWQLQLVNRDGTDPQVGDFLPNDTLTAKVWAGQDQTAIFTPTVTWAQSGNGYLSGLTFTAVTAAQCSMLVPNEVYQLQLFVSRSGGDPVCVWWGQLTVLPAASAATSLLSTYATFADLAFYGPWITEIQSQETDVAGYYNYLLYARQWLDRIIVSRARPLQYRYNLLNPMTLWGPVEAPNYTMQGYLQANYLIVEDLTREIVARRALSFIAEKNIGIEPKGDPWPARANYQRKMANNALISYRCQITLSSAPSVTINDDQGGGAQALSIIAGGVVTGVIPLYFGTNYSMDTTVTIFNGTGQGATAIPNIVNGLITSYTVDDPGIGYYQKLNPDLAFNLGVISFR